MQLYTLGQQEGRHRQGCSPRGGSRVITHKLKCSYLYISVFGFVFLRFFPAALQQQKLIAAAEVQDMALAQAAHTLRVQLSV